MLDGVRCSWRCEETITTSSVCALMFFGLSVLDVKRLEIIQLYLNKKEESAVIDSFMTG